MLLSVPNVVVVLGPWPEVAVPALGVEPLATISVCGSSRISPAWPSIAVSITVPPRLMTPSDEISTSPPLPPSVPPVVEMVPWKAVSWLLSSVTLPPLPLAVASALICAPEAMLTAAARGAVLSLAPAAARARLVPSAMVPPPAWPEALITALEATATVPVASASTLPPVLPASVPCASRLPAILMPPPTACREMVPVCPSVLLARSVPPT